MSLIKALFFLTALIAVRGQKRDYVFEFEDTLNNGQDNWQYRSNASGGKTLRINDELGDKNVTFTLCIRPPDNHHNVVLQIKNIDYSNDGPSDDVSVRFNGFKLGSFKTRERWNSGYEWNVMQQSKKVGWRFPVMNGTYDITVSAKTDQWGVELDRIVFETDYQDPAQDLICSTKFDG